MREVNFDLKLEQIMAKDPRYSREAYVFVREALDFTQKTLRQPNQVMNRQHVSAQELLNGIRQFALQQFGPMVMTVFEEWGIRRCADFGEIVFNMVEFDLLSKTDRDSREDFREGYDFADAFQKPFLPEEKTQTETKKPMAELN